MLTVKLCIKNNSKEVNILKSLTKELSPRRANEVEL